MCGECFWKGITIPADRIPECSVCKRDMDQFKKQLREKEREFIEIKPECFEPCIWWDWFDRERRDKIGCKCDPEDFKYTRIKGIIY